MGLPVSCGGKVVFPLRPENDYKFNGVDSANNEYVPNNGLDDISEIFINDFGAGNDGNYPVDGGVSNEIYTTGEKDECHYVEKNLYKDECIPYEKKICYTQQMELCEDILEKNCTVAVDTMHERECYNVTELICSLVEKIEYETIEETFTMQRCRNVKERVCDTVYDLDRTTKDDYQCVDLDDQYCWGKDLVINDRTCVYTVDFDFSKNSTDCIKVPTKKCHDTPRKIREEVCKPRTQKYCEKFTNEFPYPVEKQNCHDEPMKKCDLETRVRPRRATKFDYVTDCKPMEREVCENVERRKLRTQCNYNVGRRVCKYVPQEHCQIENKEYCVFTPCLIKEKICPLGRNIK